MRTKNWSKKKLWTFSIISILLVLLVLEIIFRIVFAVEYKGYNTSLYIQGNTLQMNDSTLVFRNRPFYVDYYRYYQFNEEGIRELPGNEYMPQKKPGDFWVFLFGGSAMEGTGSNKDGEWLDITGVTDYKPGETIAAFLEKKLQEKMPSKKVRVFNAANSGHAVWQTMERYRQLSRKYQMDWVISMDGENEPAVLLPGETPQDYTRRRWEETPVFRFPLNAVIPLTSHSAAINQLKQFLFHYRFANRLRRNDENNFPSRQTWGNKPFGEMRFAEASADNKRALKIFFEQMAQFDSLLNANHHPHLLYIQPHIAFRDTTKMNFTERALYNYYAASYNDSAHNIFKKTVYDSPGLLPQSARMLSNLHDWDQQLFVDYCHLTRQANEHIAEIITKDILSHNASATK